MDKVEVGILNHSGVTRCREFFSAPGVIVFIVVLCVLLPGFPSTFFFIDDNALINIPQLRQRFSWRLVMDLLVPGNHIDYYPLRDLSYWIDLHIFGANQLGINAQVFRFHNLALLSLDATFIYGILRYFGATYFNFLLAVLWGIHPIHWEMVFWVSGRKDLLALTFALVSFRSFLNGLKSDKWIWYLLCILTFLMSLLSKASFALGPLVGLIWYYSGVRSRACVRPLICILILCFFGLAAGVFQNWFYSNVNDMRLFYTFAYRLQASAAAFARMMTGWVNIDVNAIDVENSGSWLALNSRWVFGGVGLWFLLCAAVSIAAFRRNLTWTLALVSFIVLYLPVSGLLFPHRNFYSVRYIAAPGLAILFGFGVWVQRFSHKACVGSWIGRILVLTVLVVGGMVIRESGNWIDSLTITGKALRITPQNVGLQYMKFMELQRLKSWGHINEGELQESSNIFKSLLKNCGSANRFANVGSVNGDLCFKFLSAANYGSFPEDSMPLAEYKKQVFKRQKVLNPEKWERDEVASALWFEHQIGIVSSRTADRWLRANKYTPDASLRIQNWLALCASGQSIKARQILRSYFEGGLLDRQGVFSYFGNHRNALVWLRSYSRSSDCGPEFEFLLLGQNTISARPV